MTISIHISIEKARADTLAALLAGLARSDGRPSGDETNAPAPEQSEHAAPRLNVANLMAFLKSDPRYTVRTFAAIAKHFGDSSQDARDIVEFAVQRGDVYTLTRRADGVTLYGAH